DLAAPRRRHLGARGALGLVRGLSARGSSGASKGSNDARYRNRRAHPDPEDQMRSVVFVMTVGLVLAACGSSTSSNGGGGCTATPTKVCTGGRTQFSPVSLTVAAGTAVTWANGY